MSRSLILQKFNINYDEPSCIVNNDKLTDLIQFGAKSQAFPIFDIKTNSIYNEHYAKRKTLTNSLIHQRSRSLEENSRPPSMVAINAR